MLENKTSNKLLTPKEVAALLGVSPVTIRHWSRQDKLKSVLTPGGHRRYHIDDINEFKLKRNLALKGLRILIVDDDVSFSGYLKSFLELFDKVTDIAVANDGYTAGHMVHNFGPTLILLDLMMPKVNGFEICKMIKGDRATKYIRVVAMTGFLNTHHAKDILSEGAETCLEKPFSEEYLLQAIGIKENKQIDMKK
jgi:excisionase family DNA binding protein